MAKTNWRKILRAIHRDLGYACVGLTVVYAISGVAVNHIHEWNPNNIIEARRVSIEAVEYQSPVDDETVREVLRRLGMAEEFDTKFQRNPDTLRVIQGKFTIDMDLPSGDGILKHSTTRPLIYETNVLHLNHGKGLWTWVADAFAVSLLILAISGALILKGRQGLFGRGLWFTIGGFVLPLVFIWIYA